MMRSRTITVFVAQPVERVVGFITDPANLPRWLSFIKGVRREGEDWFMETETGSMRIRFVPRNSYGIVDHAVQLPDGSEIVNPMRVIPNGAGSEVVFTLFQLPSMTDSEFEKDARTVQHDLGLLKAVLEGKQE